MRAVGQLRTVKLASGNDCFSAFAAAGDPAEIGLQCVAKPS